MSKNNIINKSVTKKRKIVIKEYDICFLFGNFRELTLYISIKYPLNLFAIWLLCINLKLLKQELYTK